MESKLATSQRVRAVAFLSFLLFVLCGLLLPLIGSVRVDYHRALASLEPDHQILFSLRVPRVLLALTTGGALALSGVLFQALLRDALANPYTLGVSSGASLGAVSAIALGLPLIWPISIAAAMLTLALVAGVASTRRTLSPFTLLMAGVTVNSICMAGILLIHSVSGIAQSFAITRWLMGGIESADSGTVGLLSALVLAAAGFSFTQARSWNVLAVGEEWAAVRGVATRPLMYSGYFLASVLTGAVTSLTGPIGFVGLIVPHALRLWVGADHRLLIPASFFCGGAFLAICDTVARTVLAPSEIPVGVITAMLGGPFFIWLLRTR